MFTAAPCRWCYACWPTTPNTGWPPHSTPTRKDPDEYRAITRNLLHLAGTITYTTKTITVVLARPATPRLTRAVRLLLDEINTTPPRLPGDSRPITYQLTTT